MYDDCCISIERDRNGYEVTVADPKIVKQNQDKKSSDPWQSPSVEYQFDTKEQVLEFVTKVFDDALPADEYSAAFDKAAKEVKS